LILAAVVEQLATVDVKPGDQELAANTIAAFKKELVDEKQAQEEHKKDVETLSQVVEELKKMMDQLSA
jgi:KaiC/GvpD/RAD55 family RecA-like ATPase